MRTEILKPKEEHEEENWLVHVFWASLVAETAKNLPAMQETWVQSLGQQDSLEKGIGSPL